MEIFKELKKLGYKHYTACTIEELDATPYNSPDRLMEQVLVFKWFREKYQLYHSISMFGKYDSPQYSYIISGSTLTLKSHMFFYEQTYSDEKAQELCLHKLINLIKEKDYVRYKSK